MKKIIISLAIVLLLILPFSYASVSNEDGEIISDSSSLKEGDRIILPDGAMYRIVQKEELTARLDEILPEITLKDSNRRMYRYKCIGVYGINREIADIASALENYGAAALTDESGLTPEEKAQKLSYSGASLLLGVKKTKADRPSHGQPERRNADIPPGSEQRQYKLRNHTESPGRTNRAPAPPHSGNR